MLRLLPLPIFICIYLFSWWRCKKNIIASDKQLKPCIDWAYLKNLSLPPKPSFVEFYIVYVSSFLKFPCGIIIQQLPFAKKVRYYEREMKLIFDFYLKYVSIYIEVFKGLTIMEIPDEMLKEIRESGYDQELVYNYIKELLNSDKPIKENDYNLELIDNFLFDEDPQELSKNAAEIVMAAELIDNYLLDKRFMRELEDEEYDAA